ncbi:alcohol-forming fatty acyl-CoA reductase-like [Vigna unguiculata]|uniref:alcohol-forming fatty acyl-CoA reductase-like n=1 Tax=Vigna unguiculata TaxID=3917 RepID=UPI001016D854|nr:alcohol-forming fatty acyl-CoA reductase-like [Vigna unguiculata]
MEFGSVHNFLDGKTILVTGATGFLAKLLVEKILRVQPNIKKLYLLLRAENSEEARKRLQDEVLSKKLFRVLRGMWGADFVSFISQKLLAVGCDVSVENLGIKDTKLREMLLAETDIIVNAAATTYFYERLDVATGINTMGALNIVNFAENCSITMTYICGERKGLVAEEPFAMGETLNGSSKLDINIEKLLTEEKLKELEAENASEKTITSVMKNLGTIRSNLHGWPNVYAFTKAMGEMILLKMKGDIPLIIARPTIILSTHSEPFPGWIEGVRTVDLFVVMYGKGKLGRSVGRRSTIIDAIPADMVINSMIVALEACSKSCSKTLIYHIGSSLRNPFRISDLEDLAHQYFTKHPLTDMFGKPVACSKKVSWMSSVSSFHRYINIRYMLPLKGLNVMNKVCCYSHEAFYSESKLKVKKMMGIMRLYKPYLLFEGIFDDKNAENLRMTKMKAKDDDDVGRFNFDPTTIDWTHYVLNAHIPGLVKYGVK